MPDTSKFDFCPKCGALARDGVCQSCGYANPDGVPKQPASQEPDTEAYSKEGPGQPVMPGGNVNVPPQSSPVLADMPAGNGTVPPQGVSVQPGMSGVNGNVPPQSGPVQPGMSVGNGNMQPQYYGPGQSAMPGANVNSQPQYGPGQPGQYCHTGDGRPSYGPGVQNGQPQPGQNQNYGSNNMYPSYMPAPVPSKKSNKVPVIVISVIIALLLIFGVTFAAFCLWGNSDDPFRDYDWTVSKDSVTSRESSSNEDRQEPETKDREPEMTERHPEAEGERPTKDEEGLASGKYYTEIYSDIRDDLSYQVEMKYEMFEPEEYENVYVDVSYPRITGDISNLDYLNEVLEYEFLYFVEYFTGNYAEYMEEDSYYFCFSEAFVTYMDEKVMSIVFREEVAFDYFSAINLYCVNINMEDGVIMNNTELLDMDTDFAIDFRNREIIENGDELLTDYTDQEILDMLQDPDYLVIFYTPVGMEVGLNMLDVVIYVTYSDYERFLSGF